MNRKNPRFLTTLLLGIATLLGAPALAQSTYWFDTDGDVAYATADDNRAYLGVQLEEEVEHSEGGARVTLVVEGSPADRAGLRKGDIIVGFDGKTIRGPVSLTRQIHAAEPGKTVSLRIMRGGKRSTLEVEVGERKSAWSVAPGIGLLGDSDRRISTTIVCDDDDDDEDCGSTFSFRSCESGDCGLGLFWNGRPVLGVELVEVTKELREHLGGSGDVGVLVSKIVSTTPAERAGLQVGDLIVSVAGDAIKNTRDLRRALRDKRGTTFQVEVVRDRRTLSIEVDIPAPDDDRPTGPRAHLVAPRPVRVAPSPPRSSLPTAISRPASTSLTLVRPDPPAAPAVDARPPRPPRPAAPPAPPAPLAVPTAPEAPLPPAAPAPTAAPRPRIHRSVV